MHWIRNEQRDPAWTPRRSERGVFACQLQSHSNVVCNQEREERGSDHLPCILGHQCVPHHPPAPAGWPGPASSRGDEVQGEARAPSPCSCVFSRTRSGSEMLSPLSKALASLLGHHRAWQGESLEAPWGAGGVVGPCCPGSGECPGHHSPALVLCTLSQRDRQRRHRAGRRHSFLR